MGHVKPMLSLLKILRALVSPCSYCSFDIFCFFSPSFSARFPKLEVLGSVRTIRTAFLPCRIRCQVDELKDLWLMRGRPMAAARAPGLSFEAATAGHGS